MPGRILIGTSSWADPGFVDEWYPPGMAARDRLAWYADRFEYVEVNSSFYAIPEPGLIFTLPGPLVLRTLAGGRLLSLPVDCRPFSLLEIADTCRIERRGRV